MSSLLHGTFITERDLVLLSYVMSQLDTCSQTCQISLYYPQDLSQHVLLLRVDHVIKIELKFRHADTSKTLNLLHYS